MKIQLKRNNAGSSLPSTDANASGEPIWYNDRLYIRSIGSANGGESGYSAGQPLQVTRMVYVDSGTPDPSLGQNGDIYLEIE